MNVGTTNRDEMRGAIVRVSPGVGPGQSIADHQLEEFVARLQHEVDEVPEHCRTMGYGEETEADAVESVQESLRELFELAPWKRGSASVN